MPVSLLVWPSEGVGVVLQVLLGPIYLDNNYSLKNEPILASWARSGACQTLKMPRRGAL